MKNHGYKTRIVRCLSVFAIIQILLILLFICALSDSMPLDAQDLKDAIISVEKTDYKRTYNEYQFSLYSKSDIYIFSNLGIFSNYSNRELHASISAGDTVYIKYYESTGLFGKNNFVVDARTDTEVLRSIEEYNSSKEGISLFVIGVFVIMEILYLCILNVYVYLNREHLSHIFNF